MTKGRRLQHVEAPRNLRGLVSVKKPDRKPPPFIERLKFWLTTSQVVDGLWIGTWEAPPRPCMRRIEESLRLIKDSDSLHYLRVIDNLDRISVSLLPNGSAHYDRSLNACVLDERFVLHESTTLERIASTIIHEATHARLEGWGISYDEKERVRIEAICLRRELNFLAKLPHSEPLQEEIRSTLEWCAGSHDYFADASFQQRDEEGQFEVLRYLGVPDWLVSFLMRIVRRRREGWLRGTTAGK
jgi:hypothetical protein